MKFVRILAGIFLLPCCVAVSRTFYLLAPAINSGQPGAVVFWGAIGSGLVLWALVFVFLPAPTRSYILAHELTHALWGGLMGASLLGMRVSKSGGNVKLTETNVFVVLAPYFFPLYTVLAMTAYFLASVFWDLQKYFPCLLGVMGFTLGFHVFFTVSALGTRQPDIEPYGRLFSFTLIYFMNVFVVCLLLAMVSPVSVGGLFGMLADDFRCVFCLMRDVLLAGLRTCQGAFLQSGR